MRLNRLFKATMANVFVLLFACVMTGCPELGISLDEDKDDEEAKKALALVAVAGAASMTALAPYSDSCNDIATSGVCVDSYGMPTASLVCGGSGTLQHTPCPCTSAAGKCTRDYGSGKRDVFIYYSPTFTVTDSQTACPAGSDPNITFTWSTCN